MVTIKWKRYILTLYSKTFQGKSTWFKFLFIISIPNYPTYAKYKIYQSFETAAVLTPRGVKSYWFGYIQRILACVMSTWVPPFFITKNYWIMIRCWLVKRQLFNRMVINRHLVETFWLFCDNTMKAKILVIVKKVIRSHYSSKDMQL